MIFIENRKKSQNDPNHKLFYFTKFNSHNLVILTNNIIKSVKLLWRREKRFKSNLERKVSRITFYTVISN